MNLNIRYVILYIIICLTFNTAYAVKRDDNDVKWRMIWQDDFNKKKLDENVWRVMSRRNDDSRKYHSSNPQCYSFRKGKLVLKGIVNPDRSQDTSMYLTGAITTQGKKAFAPGKIEIRAKLNCAKGAWPAFWMMPFKVDKGWPADGEVDIMEHLNYDNFVYQTVHTAYTKRDPAAQPQRTVKVPINIKKFNTYGVEIREDALVYYVNGIETLRYPRVAVLSVDGQFPFYRDWYLMLCMQLGGSWVGSVDASQLPVEMEIDWVKYYQKD